MIGVPLSGGKTLSVTFRSLNTRGDIFQTYHQPEQRFASQGRADHRAVGSPRPSRRVGLASGSVSPKQFALNNQVISGGLQLLHFEPSPLVPRQEDLKKVVQLGVMRGLSSQKQKRRNSRVTTTSEKTYAQLKIHPDGVVPT